MNSNLTKRELELLQGAADGKVNKQLGNENTVKSSFTQIFAKLGAENRTHAVAIALRCGMIR